MRSCSPERAAERRSSAASASMDTEEAANAEVADGEARRADEGEEAEEGAEANDPPAAEEEEADDATTEDGEECGIFKRIKSLQTERAKLSKQRKAMMKELRNARRRKVRLLGKVTNLTETDLLEVMQMKRVMAARAKERVARPKAKAAASASSSDR